MYVFRCVFKEQGLIGILIQEFARSLRGKEVLCWDLFRFISVSLQWTTQTRPVISGAAAYERRPTVATASLCGRPTTILTDLRAPARMYENEHLTRRIGGVLVIRDTSWAFGGQASASKIESGDMASDSQFPPHGRIFPKQVPPSSALRLWKERPYEPKSVADLPEACRVNPMATRDLLYFMVFGRIDDLAHRVQVGTTTKESCHPVELPPQRVFRKQVCIYREMRKDEIGESSEGVAVVLRSADNVEDVSRLAELLASCRCQPSFADFLS